MVLDNSGSMPGTKPANVKSAAHGLADILFGSVTKSPNVKIAVVPFTAAVNVVIDKVGSSWLDQTGASSIHREDIDLPAGNTLLTLLGCLTNSGWGGCVRARIDPNRYDLTDHPPDPLVGEMLFVAYVAPDEPSSGNGTAFPETGYTNDYINDMLIPGTLAVRQRTGLKYIGAAVLAPGYGPNDNRMAAPNLPLTSVKATINSAIDAMADGDNTVIPEGLAWGWRVSSPGPPFTEGAPYVLLTDGAKSISGSSGHNRSDLSAHGFAASTNGSQTRQVLDAKTATLCNNIKGDKNLVTSDHHVFVYTIAFQIADGAARTMLQNCATPPGERLGNQCYFKSPCVAALQGVFANIALGLNQLRVAH